MKRSPAPLLLLALASPAAAEVHTVGPAGSGADFTAIQAAIDASAPGDTVLVAAGDYAGFALAKPLLVLGAGSGKTKLTSAYPVGTAVSVAGIPAGQVAVVAGMAFQPAAGAFFGNGLAVDATDGTVVLHDLLSLDEDFGQLEANLVERLVGSRLALTTTGQPGATFRAFDSRVWLVDSMLAKSVTLASGFSGLVSTARLVDSVSSFAGCTVTGADVDPTWTAAGGDAVDLEGSLLVAARTAFQGGDGAALAAGGFGARLAGGSAMLAGAATALKGGLDGTGLVEQVPVSSEPGSAFVASPTALPTLSAAPALVAAGDVLALTFRGAPGASGALFVSLAPGAGASFAGLFGEVFLDLAAPIPLGAVALDAAGEAHVSLPVPAFPEPALVTFQWAAVAGVAELSNPAFVGVL
jgi:hypothetical protein